MKNKKTQSNRYIEIAQVFIKYGFQAWFTNSHLSYLVSNKIIDKNSEINTSPPEVRLRMALEELGPTFIKLGQMLSSRADLLPTQYITELKKLQDEVHEEEQLDVHQLLEDEFHQPANEIFDEIDEKPLGIASIAQTYRVKKGEKYYVIKVRKPSADRTVNEDLKIIRNLIQILSRSIKQVAQFEPVRLFDEFELSLKNELNYSIEKRNQLLFLKYFKKSDTTTAPRILEEYSTSKILCMEFSEGVKFNDFLKNATEKDRIKVSKNLVSSYFQQIIEFGFFHADAHAGNLFVTDDLKLSFIDFGAVGRLLKKDTVLIGDFLEAFLAQETERVINAIQRISISNEITRENRKNLEYQINEIFTYMDQGVDDIPWIEVVDKLTKLLFTYKITLPNYFVTLGKSLALTLGTALEINPKMNLLDEIKPYIIKYQLNFFSLENQKKLLMDFFFWLRDIKTIPKDIKDLLKMAKKGKIDINISLDDAVPLLNTIRNGINKLTIGIIIGCILIASSTIASGDGNSLIQKFALFGYLLAGGLGLILAIDILRDLFKRDSK
ncbi:ABC1 kinase family protein [Flammeovirga agarivorans]|uniref:AarF/ABC1/UbiB kinase family protein n=1 Tax=Flammeovirga agarivorans TaxID=2726742 RepID=A0A7X8SL15_9BACT|nr:AarF/UbiB family protein [Flammeovirga agarivorans]NLR92095.1 AarF/ABC1/UbiB kinase family protein [Flammeovirga agarivorans]